MLEQNPGGECNVGGARPFTPPLPNPLNPNLLASLLPPAAVSEKCGCQVRVRVWGRARTLPHAFRCWLKPMQGQQRKGRARPPTRCSP